MKTCRFKIVNVLPPKLLKNCPGLEDEKLENITVKKQRDLTPNVLRQGDLGDGLSMKKEKLQNLFQECHQFDTVKYHYDENQSKESPWKYITEFILNCKSEIMKYVDIADD